MIRLPIMESEAVQTQSFDIFNVLAWAHTNRKRLGMVAGGVAAVAAIVGFVVWKGKHYEAMANGALSELKPPAVMAGSEPKGIAPEAFVTVADAYPGSSASLRASLLAGAAFFESGKFDAAQAQFEKFLRDCGDSPLRPQGMIGVAASLDGAGKADQAVAKYKELIDRHPTDPTMPQAKSALARLYVAQNKPDLAMKLYEDLMKNRNNDSWTEEAGILAGELLEKHPELKPAPPAPVAATPTPAPAAAGTSAPVQLQSNTPKPATPVAPTPAPVAATNAPKKP